VGRLARSDPARIAWLRCLIAALWCILFTAQADAGAWPQAKGQGLYILTTLIDRADRSLDSQGKGDDDSYFYKDELSLFAEYGLSERFTLTGRVAWQTVRRQNGPNFDSAQGFSSSEIGLRGVVWEQDQSIISLQALALIPGAGQNVSNQPLGDGDQAWEARLLWGQSWSNTLFSDLQWAHRWRGEADLDEQRLDTTLGWRPRPGWLVLVQSFSVWSAEPARPGAPEFNQHKFQISVGRTVRGVDYHIGGFITPAGQNTIDERAVFFSAWRRF
jgi:hypothetical protein